ncbi:MAG: hypothetical protein ABJH68_18465 [Ilumatobacter sp.]|uniref:hypothetical protein n=1 Tax=Ilumatobacter sp. TaxID=1967498 RepID=UPI003298376B
MTDRDTTTADDLHDDGADDSLDEAADALAQEDDAVPFDADDRAKLESQWQRTEDEALADRRVSSIAAGRRKGGVMGAAMAGAMLAIQEIYEGPKKDDMVAVSESPDEPGDIDTDGILVQVGDVDVEAKLPSRLTGSAGVRPRPTGRHRVV